MTLPAHPRESERMLAIRAVLERLDEFTDPMRGGNGDGSTGMLRMPATYWGTVREVERLVVELRGEHRNLWWHLNERYLMPTRRTVYACPKCGGESHYATHQHRDKRGHRSTYRGRRIVVLSYRVERVDQVKVRRAVEWMAGAWRPGYEPEGPDQILARLDSTKEAA